MPPTGDDEAALLRWDLTFKNETEESLWWNDRLSSEHRKTEKVASLLGILFSASMVLVMNAPLVSLSTSATVGFAGAQAFLCYACHRRDEGRLYEKVHDGTCIALRVLRMIMNFFLCARLSASFDGVLADWQVYLFMLVGLGSHLVTIPLTFWVRFKHHIWVQVAACAIQVAVNNRYTCAVCFDDIDPQNKEALMHMCEFLFEASTGLHIPCEATGFRTSCLMTGTFIPIVFGVIFTSAIVYVGEKASRTSFLSVKVS
ncbi:unnamed protein product [Ostreobium quekettii]|uniref:Uncharacterized protein n=1 Tax=Ostreobium quekettii TaxID=121088 RepID=A0A8S1J8T8_9CHLO|nr:unnamed protein product [Ostreobium quekettii]|eukprot:evm.model.scf_1518.2 EVM.evm.TU.scf_1518.2   scf_1518:7318-8091(+)